ncbi:SulP family inorganic anion transporter, partial [Bacillus cereus]|nr:SulP family inorganic anion transporter [Bacillus cereus]
MVEKLKTEWFSNVRADILAGIVVALALIPEAIAFSIIAGVDPMVGLYASFCIAVIIAFCKVARLMKFIPRAVMIGFVNALAILIFMAQVPHFIGISNLTYVFVAITLAIVYIVPRFIKSIPAPLIAIVLLTAVTIFMHLDLRTVGDLGAITRT